MAGLRRTGGVKLKAGEVIESLRNGPENKLGTISIFIADCE
jgi:hypothetical protein